MSLAWAGFGIKNGARTLDEMRARIEKYRRQPADRRQDYHIGCVLLTRPFFLPRELWIPVPTDWKQNIVQGKGYDPASAEGRALFESLQAALQRLGATLAARPAARERLPVPAEGYGKPHLVEPRLGQGAFRVLVTEVYDRRCAISGERVLPVLEAAHIRPYKQGGPHAITNGVLLRSDYHTLLDGGYLTITPDYRLEVSRRIREDFENGRDYYARQGAMIRRPAQAGDCPDRAVLEWHNQNVFLG